MTKNMTELPIHENILSHLQEAILFVDDDGQVLHGNDVAYTLLKIEQHQNIAQYVDFGMIKKNQEAHTIMELKHSNEQLVEVKSVRINDQVYCLIFQEISLKEKATELKNYIQHFMETGLEGIVMYFQERVLDCDEHFATIFGYTADEIKGTFFHCLFEPNSFKKLNESYPQIDKSLQLVGMKKDGTKIFVEMIAYPYQYEEDIVYVAIVRDITEKVENEKRIEYLAYYDETTDLPNQNYFNKVLNEAIEKAKVSNELLAVYFIDLNYFKEINDTFGYEFGNKLLKVCGNKFKTFLQTDTFIARNGGDEFIILKRNLSNKDEATKLAETLISVFNNPITIDEYEIYVSISIGISIFPENGETASELMKHADSAMYVVKGTRRNNYKVFEASISEDFKRRLLMESDLRKALQENQFELYYQPQKNIKTGKLVGMEALLRWKHPVRGYIPPLEFIPLAEKTGLIMDIGDWVINEACHQNKKWQLQGFESVTVSVNLSAKQLHQSNFVERVQEVLEQTKLEPKYLELEITESMAMSNEEYVLQTLQRLRGLGVKVSIDDFGTGYSSLKYLSLFPVTKLKIDKMFMDDSVNHNKQIVRSIIQMAQSLKMRVIAEGVETMEQLDFLEKENCDEMQGYYFSKPLPAFEIKKLLSVI